MYFLLHVISICVYAGLTFFFDIRNRSQGGKLWKNTGLNRCRIDLKFCLYHLIRHRTEVDAEQSLPIM